MTANLYEVSSRCNGSDYWVTNEFYTCVSAIKYAMYLEEDIHIVNVNLYKNDNLIWSNDYENR